MENGERSIALETKVKALQAICAGANKEQLKIIREKDNNLLLVASAGTGKTDSLARRVSYLLTAGWAKGEEILCMTFTNKACKEMKNRILSLAGKSAQEVTVMTFHSFCYMILREESKRRDAFFTERFIFDEVDCEQLVLPLMPPSMKVYDFFNWLSVVKEHRCLFNYFSDSEEKDYKQTIERLYKEKRDMVQQIFTDYKGFHAELCMGLLINGHKLVLDYNRLLQQAGGMDFTDLITGVYMLFREDSIRERWRKRFTYHCVDEMQDTSDLEYLILKSLWKGNRVLLCGDYFQTIYEWRGSNPVEILADYRENFSPKSVVFYDNYRANKTLFEATFEVLADMFPQEVKAIYDQLPTSVSKKEGAPITVFSGASQTSEARYVFNRIRALPKELASRIGILVRTNRQASDTSKLFELFNKSLPPEQQRDFMIIDEYKFFRRQEIKDVLAYFKLLINPHDVVSAKRIIARYVEGIGEARIKELESEQCRRTGLRLTDFLDLAIFEQEPYEDLLEALKGESVIVFDVESTGVDTAKDEIIQIAALRINEKGEAVDSFERFISPSKSVGESEAVHGFSDEWLREHGEEAGLVLKDFWEFTKGAVVVGHNVNYDASIFKAELERNHLDAPKFRAIYDTLDIFRRFYPNLENHKLGHLSAVFETKHKPSHNAMDDILATAELLVEAVEKNIIPQREKRREYIMRFKNEFSSVAAGLSTLRRKGRTDQPTELLSYIMKQLGVLAYYKRHQQEERVTHIRELYSILRAMEQEEPMTPQEGIRQVLQLSALTSGEADPRLKNRSRIPIITVHQAKGSEFDHLFIMGMNEHVFPSSVAVRAGKIKEEQRLFYVALTRAKESLTLSYYRTGPWGKKAVASPFLQYLPKEALRKVRERE